MLQSRKRGGYEADAATIGRAMALIASGCGSTAWVVSIYSAVGRLAELLSEEALAEIYANPHPKMAGCFGKVGAVIERADEGFRVRGGGRWSCNSGCHHASWDLLRMTVEEADGSTWPAFAAVPMDDLVVCDDWDVMGALGTGSGSVTCDALFIPQHRVATDLRSVIHADSSAGQRRALPLGLALDAFLALAASQGIGHFGYARMADAPVVQSAVARAAADIKMIEAFQEFNLAMLASGTKIAGWDETTLALGSVRCFEIAREVIERLFALCPSSEIRRSRAIQRLLRDIHVFEHQHAATPFINYERAGRLLLAS